MKYQSFLFISLFKNYFLVMLKTLCSKNNKRKKNENEKIPHFIVNILFEYHQKTSSRTLIKHLK